jgi:hypothetical protein
VDQTDAVHPEREAVEGFGAKTLRQAQGEQIGERITNGLNLSQIINPQNFINGTDRVPCALPEHRRRILGKQTGSLF